MAQQNQVQDWIEYITDHVYKYYRGREVVLWGKYSESDNIKDKLKEKYQIETAFYVDGNAEKVDNRQVFSTDCLYGKSAEYYVVVPLSVYSSVRELLIGGGYKPEQDYYYFSDCIVRQEEDYYEDAHGNKIIGRYAGMKFTFSGFDSVIEIGDNVKFKKLTVYIHSNAQIVIGDNAVIKETNIYALDNSQIMIGDDAELLTSNLSIAECANIVLGDSVYLRDSGMHLLDRAKCEIGCRCSLKYFPMRIGEYAQLLIGEDVEFRGTAEHRPRWSMSYKSRMEIGDKGFFKYGDLHLEEDSLIRIGREFTTEFGYSICSDRNTTISIGDDCMFSSNILLRSNDGHSIFDVTTGKNINSSYDIGKSRKIIIGNHVWVGMRSTILYNTRIRDGSFIGAMSLVNGEVPNNCIAAGVPVRIIRRNIAWSREKVTEDILTCGQDYIHMTEEGDN